MPLTCEALYRLPWSKTDNAGGWIEVTDACDLHCPGCYRHRLSGHRRLDDLEDEILTVRRLTNCDRIAVAGGEPLLYPQIVDVVAFIARQGIKPVLLTNGVQLTRELAHELQRAGLAKFHFHVDSGMRRPGWAGKNEAEHNELRQYFADLVWELKGVQCGFNVTIFKSTVRYLPDIVEWCRNNIHKVQHVSLIAFRAIPLLPSVEYRVNGVTVDASKLQHSTDDTDRMGLTTNAMYEVLQGYDPRYQAAAYLPGTSAPHTFKFLVTVQVGSAGEMLGCLGPRTMECVQAFHHFFTGRYCSFLRQAKVGRKLFLMALVDRNVGKAAARFVRSVFKDPRRLFAGIYVQSISLQQPNEMLDGEANLCDGCLNMMLHENRLIPSCRLDEYRIFGGPLVPAMRCAIGEATSNLREAGQDGQAAPDHSPSAAGRR